jgi:hypothetical protein
VNVKIGKMIMSKNKHKHKPTLGKGLTEAKVVELQEPTLVVEGDADPLADTKIEELLTPPEVVEVVTLKTDIKVSGGGAWG